ncbi:eukaryotic translation initiation factor 4E, partial [Trypanosoma cruzi]
YRRASVPVIPRETGNPGEGGCCFNPSRRVYFLHTTTGSDNAQMSSVLKADVKEYIPSWANKRSSGVNPAATSTNKNGFATSVPTSNVMTTHSGCTGINAQNFTSSPRAAAGLPLCSPTTALRLPTRMSPMHAPFPSVSISMNPNATDFVPHLTGANSLAPLPTSTADLAEEKERQQKQESHLSSSVK